MVIGLVWFAVGWGLLRLRDWARWTAQIMLAIGVAWTLPTMHIIHMHFGWRMIAVFGQVLVRVLAISYLFAPKVMDAFLSRRSGHGEVSPSSPYR